MIVAAVACGSSSSDTPDIKSEISANPQSINFAAEGGEESFTVTATGEWDANCSESWVKLQKSGTINTSGSVSVTAAPNNDREERTASVNLMCGTARASVSITQAAKAPEPVDPTIKVPEGYELVWNDEFNGSELDTDKWTYEVQNPGWVNNELQHYVRGSYDGTPVTTVADGILTITAFKSGNRVNSARIYGNVDTGWQYGIFEARMQLPTGKGTWPAFWMMPVNNNFSTNPWPRCGEIDIMEEVGYNPDYTSSSIHCESYNHTIGTQKTAERLTSGAQTDFHVYRLEWDEKGITTYVDDTRLLYFANDGKGNISTWPFDKPFYLILNLAWGGDWGGAMGVDESALPANFKIDYVRVFQRKQ